MVMRKTTSKFTPRLIKRAAGTRLPVSYTHLDVYKRQVYITFDEGYENGYTGKMLDILKEKGVSAVFFCTYDYIKDNPDPVSYTHLDVYKRQI